MRMVQIGPYLGLKNHEMRTVLLPSSAFCSHSTNVFICSRNTLLPFVECDTLYHFKILSSLKTSAVTGKHSLLLHVIYEAYSSTAYQINVFFCFTHF